MHVGMVSPYSLGVCGGVQEQVLGLARALRRKGVHVSVLGPCDGEPPEPWVIPLGDSIPFAQNGSLAPIAPDMAAQLRMLGAMWDQRFDLLHLHEPLVPGPTLTSLIAKRVPTIGTFHVSGKVNAYRWSGPIVRRLAQRIDIKVAVSPEAAGMAQRYLGGSYSVLFNGIEVERFADRDQIGDSPAVLFIGRHEKRKGLGTLLAALEYLPSDLQLWVAGEGPETEELKSRYGDDGRVNWLGVIDEGEKVRRLSQANVFCVPSLGGESFGLVLLEAMAARCPLVASDLPAYQAVARRNIDASFFSTGDPQDLAKALIGALSDDVQTAERTDQAYGRALEFSMSALADAYIAYYQQLYG